MEYQDINVFLHGKNYLRIEFIHIIYNQRGFFPQARTIIQHIFY